jgi:hypothetical protein
MSFGSSPFGSSPFGSSEIEDADGSSSVVTYTTFNVENFFWLHPCRDGFSFNESPELRVRFTTTSSINTTASNGYRQGVELTVMKHFDAGTVKIHAGEAGHFVKQNAVGLRVIPYTDRVFTDSAELRASSLVGLTTTTSRQVTAQPYLGTPNSRTDSLTVDRILYDGVLDPLSIRRRSSMITSNTPLDPRGVHGEFGGGRLDESGGACQIVTVHPINHNSTRPFFDAVELLDRRWPASGSILTRATGSSFVDARLLRNVATASITYPDEMVSALSLMTGSTENYVSNNQRSATSGWDYDNTTFVGTDSLSFGGMTY